MNHIINDRYASIYSTYLPGYRVGPSSPVVFNKRLQVSKWWNRQGGYMAFVLREDANGRKFMAVQERPGAHDNVLTLEAGQRADYYMAVLG